MDKKNYYLTLALSVVFLISSCQKVIYGTGSYETETRAIGTVKAIHSTGKFDITLHRDTINSIRIYAEAGILPYIVTELKPDGTLVLRYRDYNVNYKHKKIEIYVPVNGVSAIDLQGSGSVKAHGITYNQNVNLNIGGSGTINLTLNAFNVATNISGSGKIDLEGLVQNAKHVISGSGNLYAFTLLSDSTNTNISGSGRMEVNAQNYLKVNISGSGNVIYKGLPTLETTISGSGKVIKSN